MIFSLRNIRMQGNEHGQLRANTIYAELWTEGGELAIAATLEYVLSTIRTDEMQVEGITVSEKIERGTLCSKIALDLYKG